MVSASAPGKAILLGEHAVVYGRPAVAIPLAQLRAEATIKCGAPGSGLWVDAPDIQRFYPIDQALADDPLALTLQNTLARLAESPPDLTVTVRSAIPLARGMGSGAAIATALVRVLAAYFDRLLPPTEVSDLVYRTEMLFHGTPSGIDNTVVAYEQPILFIRGTPPQTVTVGGPFHFLVGDTGVASLTRDAVGDVRRAWQANPPPYEARFDRLGALVVEARAAIAAGNGVHLDQLMNTAHVELSALGVSSLDLDRLVDAARSAGALGAKLSGGGRGGISLALVRPADTMAVTDALLAAGATQVLSAQLD